MRFARERDLREFLEGAERLALYGTGEMGDALHHYLKRNGWQGKLGCFITTSGGQQEFQGVLVQGVKALDEDTRSLPVIIATRGNFHAEISRELARAGVKKVHVLSEELLDRIVSLVHRAQEREERAAGEAQWRERQGRILSAWAGAARAEGLEA